MLKLCPLQCPNPIHQNVLQSLKLHFIFQHYFSRMLVPYIALVFLLLHFEVEASSGDKLEKKLDAVESNYAKLSEAYEKLVKAIVVCVKQTISQL